MSNIKACIMAGGKGTRLRPLTSDLPKPLAPLLGKPIVFYILDLLQQHKINEAVVTLGYQGHRLKSEIIKGSTHDIDLSFSFEEKPLGTAGGVKNAMADYKGTIVIISGDAMCDFDLTKAIKFHEEKNSIATIIVNRVEDPREYGLIHCNEDGKIEGFIEKPSYHSCFSDLASTGIYILSSDVLSYIKDDSAVDFAKDVFPKLLQEGKEIFAYEDTGYWCDIGDIRSYMQCQKDMLEGKINCKIEAKCVDGVYYTTDVRYNDVLINAPAYIGSCVNIDKKTKIDSGTVICDHVTIGTDCNIKGCVLLDSVYIGNRCNLFDTVCCNGAMLENDTTTYEGSVIGFGALLKNGSCVTSGVKVWSNKTVLEGTFLTEDLQHGYAKDITIDDDGIVGETNVLITPSLCTKIGSGVASLKQGAVIGIGYQSSASSTGLHHAIISGIVAAGGNVWSFGDCIQSQFSFCMTKSMVDYGIYIEGGNTTKIKIVERGGMPTSRAIERKLEGSINRGEYSSVSSEKMGYVVPMQSLRSLYDIELVKQCDFSLDGLKIKVQSSNANVKQILEDTLIKLGCAKGDDIIITLSSNGEKVNWGCKDQPQLTHEKILTLVCLSEFLKGEDVSVAQTDPKIIDELAEKYKVKAYRYFECPCDDKDEQARQKAISKPFLRDGLMLTIKLLSFMRERELSYNKLIELLPEFNVSSRLVSISISPSVIMQKLQCDKKTQGEGVEVSANGYSAIIRPMKSGKGIMIYSESVKSETAVEICDIFEDIIKDTTLDS